LRFKLTWHADSAAVTEGLQYGITASCGKPDNDPPFSHIALEKLSSDTIFTFPELVYDTSYYIGIWAYLDGVWFAPDSLSSKKVYVSSVSSQPVSLFAPTKVIDTVRALSNKVLFWKDSSFPLGIPANRDTVIAYIPADPQLNGFIRLSKGIRFSHPEPSLPFHIALTIDSIPSKCKAGQIHIYRDSLGLFIPEDSSVLDVNKLQVSMKVADLRLPLIVLADTTPPVISVLSNISSIIETNTLYDTLLVSDNSANIDWSLYCSQGSELFTKPTVSGTTTGRSGHIICPIPAAGAQLNGIRAVLICSDGVYKDTVNLSRRGLRYNSDPISLPEKTIVPVFTTAQLDSPGIQYSLKTLFDRSGGRYDPAQFRIYRWLENKSNAGSTNKWIEYSLINENMFSITPGMLIWLISSNAQIIDLGTGTTLSLKDTASIELPPRNWTDFNNPFGFNLRLSDILRSTNIGRNDIVIYKWEEDRNRSTFRTSLVYSSIISEIDSLRDTLYGMQSGYTVYNRTEGLINLRFPPVPYHSIGSTGYFSKKQSQNKFTIRITAKTDYEEIGTVYCGIHGNSSDTFAYPLPPSFGDNSVVIRGQADNSCGILSYPFSNAVPAVFNIDIKYKGPKTNVSIFADVLTKDNGAEYALFTRKEKRLELITGNQIALQGEQGSLSLVVGDASAVASFRTNNSKNIAVTPSVNISRMRGMVGLEMSGIEQSICNWELFNLHGRRVSVQQFEHTPGKSKFIPISLPAGVYVVKMKFTKKDAVVFSMVREFSLFHEVK
jgi:hypothetical protein